MEYANVHPQIANLCTRDDGVDHALLLALHDSYSLDDMYLIDEVEQVRRSHNRAAEANAAARRGDA